MPADDAGFVQTPMTSVIELDDLSVRFGKRTILDHLRGSLQSRAIGLLGPNGAGKTTLVHTLLGSTRPSAARHASSAKTFAPTPKAYAHDLAICRSAIRSLRT